MSWFDKFLDNILTFVAIICIILTSIAVGVLIYLTITRVTWFAIVMFIGGIVIAAITTYQVRRDKKVEADWYDNFNKHMEDIKNAEKK